MSGKGKRRSARLLKLEEQKNDDIVYQIDPWQVIQNSISGSSSRGKRKRGEEFQYLQGEASCSQAIDATNSDNSSSNYPTGRIIEYILDVLELRDTYELFAMPDDIQVSDYAERVNRPGDFATLRQKNKDGMYKKLEQFENDIHMVFHKAMSINHQDTIPYREAMSLLDQAKQVFQSLKNNRMYSETELLDWHQNYVNRSKKPRKKEGNTVSPCNAAPQRANARPKKSGTDKKQENAKANNVAAEKEGRQPRGVRDSKTKPEKRASKDTQATTLETTVEVPETLERRRLTYAGESETRSPTATPAFQNRRASLVFNPHGRAYRESLQRFVRNAGLKARVAAEFRSLDCTARVRRDRVPAYWKGYAPDDMTSFVSHSSSIAAPSPSPDRADGGSMPECKLQTDELLKLVMLLGTPAFLERSKRHIATACEERTKATTADASDRKCASEPSVAALSPFVPPKLVPGRLGFGQFAASSAQPFRLKNPSSTSADQKHASH